MVKLQSANRLNKKPLLYACYKALTEVFRTPGRDRTGTSSHSLVFETNASTNSATGAKGHAKVRKVIDSGANFSRHRIGYFLQGVPVRCCGKGVAGNYPAAIASGAYKETASFPLYFYSPPRLLPQFFS